MRGGIPADWGDSYQHMAELVNMEEISLLGDGRKSDKISKVCGGMVVGGFTSGVDKIQKFLTVVAEDL